MIEFGAALSWKGGKPHTGLLCGVYWVFDSRKFRLHSRLIVALFLGVSRYPVLVQKLLQGRWKDTGMILKAGETKDNVMTKQFWLKLAKAPQIHVRRALDNRIVFCANCEGNQTLGVSSSGNLACSSCGSENWMHLSAPIIANFRKYDERKVQERIAVDKYMDTLKHEVFFTSNGAALV